MTDQSDIVYTHLLGGEAGGTAQVAGALARHHHGVDDVANLGGEVDDLLLVCPVLKLSGVLRQRPIVQSWADSFCCALPTKSMMHQLGWKEGARVEDWGFFCVLWRAVESREFESEA